MFDLAAKLDRPGLAWIISCQAQSIGYAFFVGSYLFAGNTIQRVFFYTAIMVPFLLYIGHKTLHSVFRSPLFLISILLMVYLWLTVLWSTPGGLALFVFESRRIWMLGAFIAMTAFLAARCPDFLRTVPLVLAVLGALSAIAALVMSYGIEGNPFPRARLRSYGRGSNPLDATPVYSIIIVWVVVWLSEERAIAPRLKWLATICLAPMLGFLVMAQGRAALLAIALSLVLLLLLRRTDYVRHAAIVGGILALVFIGLLMGPLDQIIERGLSYRPQVWRVGLDYALQKPWFGHGLLNKPNLAVERFVFQHPHNVLIVVLLQGGIIALGAFLWVLVAYARVAWRQFRRDGSALLLVLMMCGFTNAIVDFYSVLTSVDRVWFAIWLPVGLAIAYELRSADTASEIAVGQRPAAMQAKP